MSKYLEFKQVPYEGKTKRFEVISKNHGFILGRVYDEVQQLKRELHNKVNNWELSSLQGKIDALSQDVRTLSESVMDIYNKIDELKNG